MPRRKTKAAQPQDNLALAQKQFSDVMSRIIVKHPFYAGMLLRSKVTFDTRVKTAGVDAKNRMYINPNFFAPLCKDEQLFLIMHEAWHIIGCHAARRFNRDPRGWNIAADWWINESLIAEGLGKFIECGLRFDGAKDKSVDELYRIWEAMQKQPEPPQPPQPPQPEDEDEDDEDDNEPTDDGDTPDDEPEGEDEGGDQPCDDGDDGKGGNNPSDTPADGEPDDTTSGTGDEPTDEEGYGDEWVPCDDGEPDEAQRRDIVIATEIAVLQAAKAAEARGLLPASIKKLVSQIKESRLAWYDRLEPYFYDRTNTESSWMRKNRRFDVYLPSNKAGYALGEIVVQIDVSGSITQQAIDSFNGHVTRILQDCPPRLLHVLYTDTSVIKHETYEAEEIDDFKVEYVSGGGTWMESGFVFCKDNEIEPDLFITLTDGWDEYNVDNAPDYPTVWLMTERKTPAPYGDTIFTDLND
jgi:predicted metal-dependent peptidase